MKAIQDSQVVLGVTGCIAAYKSAEIIRGIVQEGGRVDVVMTEHATQFITPLTLQTLSGAPVVSDMFSLLEEREIGHISLAQRADIIVIAPATANSIGKAASGIAGDMLSTVLMATQAPVLMAPAMNDRMWNNPVLKRNLQTLRDIGYHIVEPGCGELACGTSGQGRLAETADILDAAAALLTPNDLSGTRILVTAGPTREYIDPVRFLSNPSSGRMGYALARAAGHRGARVTLVTGPTSLSPPRGVTVVPVVSASEMADAVADNGADADAVIMAAAVGDYAPAATAPEKIKKNKSSRALTLKKTKDILAGLGKASAGRVLVGFAAETEHLEANAREKLAAKRVDLIVANDVGAPGAGFGADTNRATIIAADGRAEHTALVTKSDLAHTILDRVAVLLQRKTQGVQKSKPARRRSKQ